MTQSSRLALIAAGGAVVAVLGFLLTLDLWNLGTVTVNGVRFGQNTDKYVFLGRVMLCVGAALCAFAAGAWAVKGPDAQP